MKINIMQIKIDYIEGMLFISSKDIAFTCQFSEWCDEITLDRKYIWGLQCQYEADTPEYLEIKEQLIQIASGVLNVIEMAGE
jgi:hypothetical protein